MKPRKKTSRIVEAQQLFNVRSVTEYASTNAQKNADLGKPSILSVGQSSHGLVVLFSKLANSRDSKRGDEVTIHLTPNDALRLATELINQVNFGIPNVEHSHPELKKKLEAELEREAEERKEQYRKKIARKKSQVSQKRESKRDKGTK